MKGWDKEHDLVKLFEVGGIPFIILVDRSGHVCYAGHPSKINLEEKVNELVKMTCEESVIFHENSRKK